MIHVVRHAEPEVRPDTPPDRWPLTPAEHTERAAGRPLVLGTQGMALTVWLRTVAELPDPTAFWAALRFPDLLRVDPAARTVLPEVLP
ncbi:hypothetical protein [Actinocatenispora rupis]|uniref:Histidine phosphatase superfamily (Branch 1) n=1 Tax=Actinocatenispora rupis TaxID=519421 RepID=A0A8J3JGX0_9ACTN|nr:hypothetical protein [Actinocatenispora rupis]GID15688.1 hypothetical protein Aru02nite_65770 [Actinocatenispora rupis]